MPRNGANQPLRGLNRLSARRIPESAMYREYAMGLNRTIAVSAALVLAGCTAGRLASGPAPVAAPEYTTGISDLMPTGMATAAPAGWVDYCRRHPGDSGCGPAR